MEADFLVIGSGISGLNFALQAKNYGKVMVVTKKEIIESNTNYAQGGIAAVMGESDDFKYHVADTLKVGEGLCNKRIVELMVKAAPEQIQRLIDLGVGFDREQGSLALSREGGHSRRRVIHAGDMTGNVVEKTLVQNLRDHRNIEVRENAIAVDLIIRNNRCFGAKVLDIKNERMLSLLAPITVIATGGVGQLYSKTSNPEIATGDGIAMALRAGSEIADMEFVQFHPTVLDCGKSPYFLISETVRGEGGILRNSLGEAFMVRYHPLKDLAPRDVVSRAVVEEQKKGPVFLDVRHKGEAFLKKRFPSIYRECLKYGICPAKDLIPVSPATHYLCGGIRTNEFGETNIPGLFAFGECACIGVHGANRLASNSMLECLVFTTLAFKRVKRYLGKRIEMRPEPEESITFAEVDAEAEMMRRKVQDVMWRYVGIIRSVEGLRYALSVLQDVETQVNRMMTQGVSVRLIELRNMIAVAELITSAALIRRESRGTHFLKEYPERDDRNWLKHIIFSGGETRIENHIN
ncbi:L-aspartate oxidase [Candidatus Bathyarchaeota archaeon]|nr:MAG: L-aspartate oxidase [Candidatus Bathyarchaeota archaeon]